MFSLVLKGVKGIPTGFSIEVRKLFLKETLDKDSLRAFKVEYRFWDMVFDNKKPVFEGVAELKGNNLKSETDFTALEILHRLSMEYSPRENSEIFKGYFKGCTERQLEWRKSRSSMLRLALEVDGVSLVNLSCSMKNNYINERW